jgi:hypothetical protein
LVELLDGPAIDELGEDIGQIGLRVDAVKLGGLCRLPNYAEWFWEEPVICAYLRVVERSSSQFHSA